MGLEIERKFLVINSSWRSQVLRTVHISQGYFYENNLNYSLRIRICDQCGSLNIKSLTIGIQRIEYEYNIPLIEAKEMLEYFCSKTLIEKMRYYVNNEGHMWEIDEFMGDNAGLIIAEIELKYNNEHFLLPQWVGQEVSHDARYYNIQLAKTPYKYWAL